MAHQHHHDDDTYFLDQICMVALSGAFGVICLCMYFLPKPQEMMFRLLGTQFHPFILASGITLVIIAVLRAGMLWSMAGAKREIPVHDHAHDQEPADHEHAHSHGEGGHDHGHAHSHGHEHSHSHGESGHGHAHSHSHEHSHSDADCCDDQAHAHAALAQSRAFGHTPTPAPVAGHSHDHGHSHSHGNGDHEHGWAPWRYVVLLVPIILFMLGLPSKGPSIVVDPSAALDTTRDVLEEAQFHFTLAALSADRSAPIGVLLARAGADADAGDLALLNVKELEQAAATSTDRDYYKGKSVRVKGQIVPHSERYFDLVRFRIQCCAGDAVQVSIPVIAKDNYIPRKPQIWVEVTGKIDFRTNAKGEFKTVVQVANRNHVRECNPDLNPYLQ